MPPAIRCVDLVKEYRTQKVVRALDFVHLDVGEGVSDGDEIVARLRQLPGVSHATTEGNLRLYCDNGFAVLKAVVATLEEAGQEASVSMVELSQMVTGMFVPLQVLPAALRWFGIVAIPQSMGMDLLRHYVMDTNTVLDVPYQWAILVAQLVGYGILAKFVVGWLERSARERGLHYI